VNVVRVESVGSYEQAGEVSRTELQKRTEWGHSSYSFPGTATLGLLD